MATQAPTREPRGVQKGVQGLQRQCPCRNRGALEEAPGMEAPAACGDEDSRSYKAIQVVRELRGDENGKIPYVLHVRM